MVTMGVLVGIELGFGMGSSGMSGQPTPALGTTLEPNAIHHFGLRLAILGRNTAPMLVSLTQRFLALGLWTCRHGTRLLLGTGVHPMAFLTTIVTLAGSQTLLNQSHEVDLGQIEHRQNGLRATT